MNKFIRIIVILALVCQAFMSEAGAQEAKGPGTGDKFIDFEVVQPDGKTLKLSDFAGKGKYVIVDFWASWCGPCREEIPGLKDLWYEFKDKGLDIVGVPVYDEPKKTLNAVEEFKIPWKQILGVPESVPEAYGFDYIPYIILISPDGTILETNLRGDAIRSNVKKYLNIK